MRTLFSIVAAVIRAMSARVYQWVRVNGRWLLRMLPGISPPTGMADVLPFPDQGAGDPVASLKRAAGRLSQAHLLEPADILGLAEREVDWLEELTRRQLCIVMTAGRRELEAHLAGRAAIAGLPSLDQVGALAPTEAPPREPAHSGLANRRTEPGSLEPSGELRL